MRDHRAAKPAAAGDHPGERALGRPFTDATTRPKTRLVNPSTWSLVSCVWCLACGIDKTVQTPADVRPSSAAARGTQPDAATTDRDLTTTERDRFLENINDQCADTYCEGSFGFEFDGLECRFSEAECAISFVMFTDEPTRPGLTPSRITSSPDDEEPFVAVIESVIPPTECDPLDLGMEQGGPPCTIVEAGCVLAPVRSVSELESLHWDLLSPCVFALEDAILPATSDAEETDEPD